MAGFVAILSCSVFAQTDQARVTRYADFLGKDKFALLVWQKTTRSLENPDQYDTKNNEIKFMDTKNGVVSVLKKDAASSFIHPSFTRNGKYIVYFDQTKRIVRKMDVATKADAALVSGAGRS